MGSLVKGHKRSAGWICGEYGGRNISSTPSGTSRSLERCQPAPSSTRMMCLLGPADISVANDDSSALTSAVLTQSAMNLAGGGPDEAIEIEPLVAVVATGGQLRGAQTLRR